MHHSYSRPAGSEHPPQYGPPLQHRCLRPFEPAASHGFPLSFSSVDDSFLSVPDSVGSDPTAMTPSARLSAVHSFMSSMQQPAKNIPPAVQLPSIHIPSPTLHQRRTSSNNSSSTSPALHHRQFSVSSATTPSTLEEMTPTSSYATHLSSMRNSGPSSSSGRDPLMEWHGGSLEHWFELDGLIGRGAFCDVYRAVRRDSGTPYAVKIFRTVYYNEVADAAGNNTPTTTNASMAAVVQHEMQVLKQCRHENIVSYYGCLPSASGQLCLVMDLCEGGSVKELLQNSREPLLERHIAYIVRCVLLALEYLHDPERQIVHRDVKAANILLSAEGRVRLADFGISAHTRPFAPSANYRFEQDMAAINQRKLRRLSSDLSVTSAQSASDVSVASTSDDSDLDTTCDDDLHTSSGSNVSSPSCNLIGGSPLWMAPESLRGAAASSAGDVWSLGTFSFCWCVLALLLLLWSNPFSRFLFLLSSSLQA